MRLIAAGTLLAFLALGAVGCATAAANTGFKDTQRRYTNLVRWAEFERAGQFVNEDEREAFLEQFKGLERVRFTDYEIEKFEHDTSARAGYVRVSYDAYEPASLSVISFVEEQNWLWVEEMESWQVKTAFSPREYTPFGSPF